MPFDGWSNFGSPANVSVNGHAVAQNDDGRLEIFVRTTVAGDITNPVWHIWQGAGGAYSDWSEMGVPPPLSLQADSLGLGLQHDRRLKFFIAGVSNVQTERNNGWTDNWQSFFSTGDSLPGSSGSNYYVVQHEQNGRMNVFGVLPDDRGQVLVRTYETDRFWENEHGWADIEELTTGNTQIWGSSVPALDFDVGTNQDGRMEAFVRSTDSHLWHTWQTKHYSKFSPYFKEENPSPDIFMTGRPAVSNNEDGRLEVVAAMSDGQLWDKWQVAPDAGWSPWVSLGGAPFRYPVLGLTSTGLLSAVAPNADGSMMMIQQTVQNNGWGNWLSLGGESFTDYRVVNDAAGRLILFATAQGALWMREIG